MRGIYGDHERFENTYFQQYKGYISPVTDVDVMKMDTIGLRGA